MPRTTTLNAKATETMEPLESTLEDIRVLVEARRVEYLSAAARLQDILLSMAPKPRIGRPPTKR